jgi:ADP-heptose:LPS heptosyltransferase
MMKLYNSREPLNRQAIRSILIVVDNIDDTKIGDTILRVSRFRFIHHYFGNARIAINTSSAVWKDVTRYSTYIDNVTGYEKDRIPYHEYDLVILVVDNKKEYLNAITDHMQAHAQERDLVVASIYDSIPKKPGDVEVPFLKEIFECSYPGELVSDINKYEIFLSDQELHDASRLLDEHLSDEKLIIYYDKASEFRKMFKMSVNVDVIRHFQSLKGKKLVLLDPFNEGKEEFYRTFGVDTSNILILNGLSFRQTCAVMADSRVELVMGPCTGLMHAASGVYNFLMKNKGREQLPIMLVYTGLYTGNITNAGVWWRDRLVDCIVLRKDAHGNPQIEKLPDIKQSQLSIQKDVLPCRDYTLSMITNHLKHTYNFAGETAPVVLG